MKLDFNYIKSLFSDDLWDVGYLSQESFERLSNVPLKYKYNFFGSDATDPRFTNIKNGIILFKYCEKVSDYTLYLESEKILKENISTSFTFSYLNFKEAALVSGCAHRAKNSLVYNRKFGFQCKICCYMFEDEIVNYEVIPESTKLLDLCDGCTDCIKNCPVGAIHETWVDSKKCFNFLGFGNHPDIISTKWFWYEKMAPNIPKEVVEGWDSWENCPPFEWGHGVDGYYEIDNQGHIYRDGQIITAPICNQCQKQPKCSKAPYLS